MRYIPQMALGIALFMMLLAVWVVFENHYFLSGTAFTLAGRFVLPPLLAAVALAALVVAVWARGKE